jgi:hypothetical protein
MPCQRERAVSRSRLHYCPALLLVLFITLCLFDSTRWHGENKRRQSVRGQIYYALSLRTPLQAEDIIIACRFISYASKNKMIINAAANAAGWLCLPLGGWRERQLAASVRVVQ